MTSKTRSPSKDKKVIITVLITAVIFFILFVVGLSTLVFSILQNSEPSQKHYLICRTTPLEELGEPIEWILGIGKLSEFIFKLG